ncbi:MAG TPA: glycosyltransferase family 39 protein [Patescibacteria group bacterium]|nr:glycosyltransferase family 39 protein [Patescibacteria group bacterium]
MSRARRNSPVLPAPAPAAGSVLERRAGACAAALLALLAIQGIVFITESSQTSDEAAHLSAGYSYLKTADFRLNPEHPPLIKELAALPLLPLHLDFPWGPLWEQAEEWNIGRLFVHENRVPNDTILFLARMPVLALSVLLGWCLFLWGRRLFGAAGALLALALYVLDPNVVAHSGLVTTDLGITLFIFLSVVAFQRWIDAPSPRALLLFGLAVGGAFASKYTALWLPPILAAIGGALLLRGDPLPPSVFARSAPPVTTPPPPLRRRLAVLLAAAAVVLAIAFAVLALVYGVVGLPAFVTGLQRTLHHSAIGHRAYLGGQVSETGWWYYFLLAWLLKTPPGTLILVAAAVAAMAAGRRLRTRDEIILNAPIVVVLIVTCFWKVNIGLRHLLPIYPFLYVGAGRLLMPAGIQAGIGAGTPAATSALKDRARKALVAVALSWTAFEAAAIAPYDLAYFNLFAGGPANGHKWLLDSNLDWGQSAKALRRYVAAQGLPMIYVAYNGNSDPWYYGVRYQYVPGSGNLKNAKERPARVPDGVTRELLAVNVMVLHSLHFSDRTLYDWLLARRPIAMPGYSYVVFDITGESESHGYIAVLCLSFGLVDLAEFEANRALRDDPRNALAAEVLKKIAEGPAPEGADSPPPGPPPGPPP